MQFKQTLLASVLCAAVVPAVMAEGLSANIGLTSDYFFRGVDQGVGATGSAGVDYDIGNGVAIGVWAADVTDGIEYDLYGAYSGEYQGFSYSVGFTGYYYTGDTFDDTYQEINLGVGYGPISLAYAKGTHDNLAGGSDDYSFLSITGEYNNLYATYGTWGDDFEGSYFEFGVGTTIAEGTDLSAALIFGDEDLSNQVDSNGEPASDTSLVVTVTKSFDL